MDLPAGSPQMSIAGRPGPSTSAPRGRTSCALYLLRPSDAYCFSPADSEAKRKAELRAQRKSPVQPSQANRRKSHPKRKPRDFYGKEAYRNAIRRAVDRANRDRPEENKLPHWHPNQLRHSAATEIRRLFGLEAAAGDAGSFPGRHDANLRGA